MNETILKKQIKQGANQYFKEAGVEIPKPEFSDEELEQCIISSSQVLNQSGYIVKNNEEFASKVKMIFGRILDMNSLQETIYVNLLDECNKQLIKYPNNNVDYKGFYISKSKKMITDFFYLPELVNYEKLYPNIQKEEKEMPKNTKDSDGDDIIIEKWRDIKDLNQLRFQKHQLIISRNKYLFNESKPDFAWLKFNDKNFLRSLVLNFGYTKDKDLLKLVMESIKLEINSQENNAEEFGKLLWHKDCSGKLKIHTETFELMNKNNKKAYPKYEDDLYNYIRSLIDKNTEISFAEKAKIIAHCLHFMATEKAVVYNYLGEFAEFWDYENNFSKEFEKNNFYSIPNFKEEWKEAKEEGNGITKFEELPGNALINLEAINKNIHLYSRPDFQSYTQEITTKGEIEYLHKISGWDFVKIGAVTGYLATEEAQKEKEKIKKKKNSFLADEEIKEEPKKKGFLGGLFG